MTTKTTLGLFITGTDTGVGKTIITGGLALALQQIGLRVGVVKPVQTGCPLHDPSGDAMQLKKLAGLSSPVEEITLYSFLPPVSPALASEMAQEEIQVETILRHINSLKNQYDILLIEGAGGLMVPIHSDQTILHLAKKIDFPLLVVARPGLGTVNHTLLTLFAAQQCGLDVLGVICNGYRIDPDISTPDNPRWIEKMGGVPVLGQVPWMDSLTPEHVAQAMEHVQVERIVQLLRTGGVR